MPSSRSRSKSPSRTPRRSPTRSPTRSPKKVAAPAPSAGSDDSEFARSLLGFAVGTLVFAATLSFGLVTSAMLPAQYRGVDVVAHQEQLEAAVVMGFVFIGPLLFITRGSAASLVQDLLAVGGTVAILAVVGLAAVIFAGRTGYVAVFSRNSHQLVPLVIYILALTHPFVCVGRAIKSKNSTSHWAAKLVIDVCAGGVLAAFVIVGSLAMCQALGMADDDDDGVKLPYGADAEDELTARAVLIAFALAVTVGITNSLKDGRLKPLAEALHIDAMLQGAVLADGDDDAEEEGEDEDEEETEEEEEEEEEAEEKEEEEEQEEEEEEEGKVLEDESDPEWVGKELVGQQIKVAYPNDDGVSEWWDVTVSSFNKLTKKHTLKGDGFTSREDLEDCHWRYA